MTDQKPAKRPKVHIQEAPVLVPLAQSSKLAALRNRAMGSATTTPVTINAFPADLTAEVAAELRKARRLLDQRCEAMMATYPQGKQKRFFALRFGSLDDLQRLPIIDMCKRLAIEPSSLNWRLLAKLNYHGDKT